MYKPILFFLFQPTQRSEDATLPVNTVEDYIQKNFPNRSGSDGESSVNNRVRLGRAGKLKRKKCSTFFFPSFSFIYFGKLVTPWPVIKKMKLSFFSSLACDESDSFCKRLFCCCYTLHTYQSEKVKRVDLQTNKGTPISMWDISSILG